MNNASANSYRWHQDVKPSNILVTTVGATGESRFDWEFKLADLGISHFEKMATNGNGKGADSQGTKTYGIEITHNQ
jgi:serine/threonine protein kinase